MHSHSVMSDSATPWTIDLQATLSIGILQARILEWVAMPSCGQFSTMQKPQLLLHQPNTIIRNAYWCGITESRSVVALGGHTGVGEEQEGEMTKGTWGVGLGGGGIFIIFIVWIHPSSWLHSLSWFCWWFHRCTICQNLPNVYTLNMHSSLCASYT